MNFIGSRLFRDTSIPSKMIEDLRTWAGLPSSDTIELFEEIKAQSIKPVLLDSTLAAQDFMSGDILIIQATSRRCRLEEEGEKEGESAREREREREHVEAEKEKKGKEEEGRGMMEDDIDGFNNNEKVSPPFAGCREWYEYLNNRIVVSFRALESVDATFSLTLDRTMKYETVSAFVGSHIDCPAENIRFYRPPQYYTQLTPLSPSDHFTLETMLGKAMGSLVYEILPMPLREMEKKRNLTYIWRNWDPLEMTSHTAHLADTDTVADLITQAKQKHKSDAESLLRVLLLFNHSIEYVFHPSDSAEMFFRFTGRHVVVERVQPGEEEAQKNLEEFYRSLTGVSDRKSGKRDANSANRASPDIERKRRKLFREERESDGSTDTDEGERVGEGEREDDDVDIAPSSCEGQMIEDPPSYATERPDADPHSDPNDCEMSEVSVTPETCGESDDGNLALVRDGSEERGRGEKGSENEVEGEKG